MATNYPTSLDTGSTTLRTDITATTELDDVGFYHDEQHVNAHGAVIAVETKLGVGSSDASAAGAGTVLVHSGSGSTGWSAAATGVTSVGTLSSLTVSGDVTVDTDTLYVDSTNNRVGIGTTSPQTPLGVDGDIDIVGADRSIVFGRQSEVGPFGLEVWNSGSLESALYYRTSPDAWSFENSSGTDILTVDIPNQRVGIGTTSPSYALDVSGDIHIQNAAPYLIFTDTDTSAESRISAASGVGSLVIEADYNNEVANTNIVFKSDGTERMRINSSGNVGIGTDSPSERLEIYGDGATYAKVFSGNATGAAGITLHVDTDTTPNDYWTIYQSNGTSHALRFYTGAIGDAVTIKTDGNVGIGTTSPTAYSVRAFHLHGTTSAALRVTNDTTGATNGDGLDIAVSGSTAYIIQREAADLRIATAAVDRITVTGTGNVGIGETSPSRKLHVNDYNSGNRTYPLMVTNGTPGGGGVSNTEAAIWLTTSNSTGTSRGAYISAVNTGGGGNGHDLVFAVSANTQFPSEGMRLIQNKQLVHHRSGAFCGGPSSFTSAYKNYWSVARSRGTFLTAGTGGITVNRSGFYYVRYVQRSDGTGSPYGGIGESGNRTTLETRTTGIWTHDHGGAANAHMESVYVGYLAANELITAGAVNSTSAADLVFSSSSFAGILYAVYLGE